VTYGEMGTEKCEVLPRMERMYCLTELYLLVEICR